MQHEEVAVSRHVQVMVYSYNNIVLRKTLNYLLLVMQDLSTYIKVKEQI